MTNRFFLNFLIIILEILEKGIASTESDSEGAITDCDTHTHSHT